MSKRMWLLNRSGALRNDTQCSKSPAIYGDPIQAEMMLKYQNKLEDIIRKKLYPTYSYARIYQPKETLKYHSDRPSCEISLTATLDFDTYDDKPWPIWIESNAKDAIKSKIVVENSNEIVEKMGKSYWLYPGDIIVYMGCQLAHWREQFVGVSQAQVFMHYVDKNGPHANQKYDNRHWIAKFHESEV